MICGVAMIRSLVVIAVATTLVACGSLVWQRLDQPVRAVRVEGTLSEAEQQAIRQVVQESVSEGLLSLDLETLTGNILALSWPRVVHLRRAWPHSLIISVERESAVASWGRNGYLTSAGKIVQLPDGAPELPVLETHLSSPRQAMEIYQLLQKQLDVSGLKIQRLNEDQLGEWQITLESGLTLALGNDHLTERVRRFLTVYRKVLRDEQQNVLHVDARYGNGVAVSRASDLLAMDATPSLEQNGKSRAYGFGQ